MTDSLVTRSKPDIRIPRRRPQGILTQITSTVGKITDIDFVFQKSRPFLFYGFPCFVVYIGMTTEPAPESVWEIINLFE